MKIIKALACAALLASTTSIRAAQTPMVIGGPAETTVLRAGTAIPIRTLTELTTNGKKLKVGARFNVEVSEPVLLNGQVVIPVGSPGMGEVTSVRNKGMWGKSGNIEARLLYIRVGDRQIRVTGNFNDKGVTGTAGVVGAVLVVPVVGFFVTGTSAVIPSGSTVSAFLDEDVPVAFAGPQPAPVVATPVQASTMPVAATTAVAPATQN